MIRLFGRIEPGRGSAVFTGHPVTFIPPRIAETSARLSFLLRPGTDGTVMAAGFALSAFARDASVAESIATTCTGSSAGALTIGGVVDFASLTAHATISGRLVIQAAK